MPATSPGATPCHLDVPAPAQAAGAVPEVTGAGSSQPAPMRHGRWLVLLAISLVGLNLRPAVTAITPMLTGVRQDFALGATATGLLGALPEMCFAAIGAATPLITRRFGLERTIVLALVLTAVGQAVRAMSFDAAGLLGVSAVAMAGMAMANVALPPLVKRYFPDRIGPVTGLYTLMLAIGTALPALVAVPMANLYGWRGSAGSWSLLAAIALVPWLTMLRGGRPRRAARGADDRRGRSTPSHQPVPVWRTPLAWGLAVFFGMTSLNTYVMFAWLPDLLTSAGVPASTAGAMLSLFAAVGMPIALIVPPLAARMRNPFPLVLVFLTCFVAGYLGLLLAPTHLTVIWVVVAGLGPSAFPMSLAMVGLRTRTHAGASQLSGFMQGVGYAIAAIGPIAFGALHDATGGYRVPFAMLAAALVVWLVAGWLACKPDTVEHQLEHRCVRTQSE